MNLFIKRLTSALLCAFVIIICTNKAFSATRTWSGASTGTVAWTGNWGVNPVAGDDIEITTTGTLIITGMPALALNSITIHGGSNYTVEFQGANTLTVGGNAGTDFVIDASTGFILSATNAPSITMAASATSTINGVFTINAGCTFTMSNASVVNTVSTTGSIVNSGTITGATTAKLIFEGASSYTHAQNGGTIPTADWDGATGTATSTCTVTGMTTTKPGGLVTTSNTFYHFTWNCTGQIADLISGAQGGIAASGENFTCLGNFTIANTNGYYIAFSEINGGALSTLTVGGNMSLNDVLGCFFYFNKWDTPVTANISGNLSIAGTDVYIQRHATSGATTTVNVTGSVTVSDGSLRMTYADYSDVILNISGSMNVSGGDFLAVYNGTASPTLNVTQNVVVSSGWFYGLYFGTGSPDLNVTGNITVSGGNFYLSDDSGGTPALTVGGSVTVSSGWFTVANSTGNAVCDVTGSVTVSGGTLYVSYGTGIGTLNVGVDVNVSSGWFGASRTTASAILNITRDVNISGTGVFTGSESTTIGTPVLTITRDINISAGWLYGSYDVGGCTFAIGGNVALSGTGVIYVTGDAGSPTIGITGNLTASGGTFYGTDGAGSPTINVTGNVAISGTASFRGTSTTATGDPVFNITGDLTTSGGSTFFSASRASGANPIFNIQGSVDLSTGTSYAGNTYTSNTPICTFNLTGAGSNNLKLPTGLTYNSGAAWTWNISAGRTITLQSNVEMGGTASSCVFTNNGTLIMGTYTFPAVASATASFVNASGATLRTAHLSGLSTTAATGAIQVTGTKTFSSAASYVFNGAAAQVMGNFGASTTPSANTVANLELNNASGVTFASNLTIANAGTLTLTTGYHDLATYTLQLGVSAANTLAYTAGGLYSSTDNGTFTRYIPIGAVTSTSGNYYGLFPFQKSATRTNILELNSTADVTTGGFIAATAGFAQTVTDVVDFADDNGTVQALKTGKGITLALTDIAGGTFGIRVTSGNYTGGTLSDYTLVTYTGGLTDFQTTFAATTGTTTNPIVARTGVSLVNLEQTWVVGTYDFGATTLPIELVSFAGTKDGSNNILFWTTETELNNDIFTVEKTMDGEVYEIVGTMDGAGNSNQLLTYTLTDDDVRQVLNYYRLKQTDFDGKFTYSNVITIDNRMSASKEISFITNILGQEVNEYYRGVVIIVYTDGTSIKVIQ